MTPGIEVEIFTRYHFLTGSINAGPRGLYGYINQPTVQGIEIFDANYYLIFQMNEPAAQFGKVWLARQAMKLVYPVRRMDMGTSALPSGGYTRPLSHWVRILVGGYELVGSVQTRGSFDIAGLLYSGDQNFIPVYKCYLQAAMFPNIVRQIPLVLFNRDWVSSIHEIPPREIVAATSMGQTKSMEKAG